MSLVPSEGLGIIVLTNAFPTGVPEGIADTFLAGILGGETGRNWVADWNEVYASLFGPALEAARAIYNHPPANGSAALALPAYAGTYSNDYLGTCRSPRPAADWCSRSVLKARGRSRSRTSTVTCSSTVPMTRLRTYRSRPPSRSDPTSAPRTSRSTISTTTGRECSLASSQPRRLDRRAPCAGSWNRRGCSRLRDRSQPDSSRTWRRPQPASALEPEATPSAVLPSAPPRRSHSRGVMSHVT